MEIIFCVLLTTVEKSKKFHPEKSGEMYFGIVNSNRTTEVVIKL